MASDAAATPADIYPTIFDSNKQWRSHCGTSDPDLLPKLGKGQSPQILWIGCSDSRCPETTVLGLKPGDVFVHRNIANILTSTDLSSLSVIEYAVTALKVKHIIVCGHSACGGVAAALGNKKIGLIDAWLMPLRAVRNKNIKALDALPADQKWAKLVELNVQNSVQCVLENPVVIHAIETAGLKVHGLVYDVGTGELNELDFTEDGEHQAAREGAFKLS